MVTSAPASCACSHAARRSLIRPSLAGYWRSTPNTSAAGRVLEGHPEQGGGGRFRHRTAEPDAQAAGLGAGAYHVDRLRMAFLRYIEDVAALAAARLVAHRHRLGGRGSLIQQRGVCD